MEGELLLERLDMEGELYLGGVGCGGRTVRLDVEGELFLERLDVEGKLILEGLRENCSWRGWTWREFRQLSSVIARLDSLNFVT